jgi:hypothetical protein
MSSLVFPFHDPNNIETKLLKQILPILKQNFDKAFVSVTPKTVISNPESINFFQQDDFFLVNTNSDDSFVGDHLVAGYKNAVKQSEPDQILHLCYSDRTIFTLLNYKQAFFQDINSIGPKNTPTLFLRSPKAWATHPKNYHMVESMVTEAGRILFGKTLDFTWCHLALTAKQLGDAIPSLNAHDLVVLSQLAFYFRDRTSTKEVDWLSWEDPFVFDKDPQQYKIEKESDPMELEKRMNYALPEIKYLFEEYRKLQH